MDEDDDMDGDGEEGVEVTEEVAMDEGEEEQGPVQDDSVRVFLEHHGNVRVAARRGMAGRTAPGLAHFVPIPDGRPGNDGDRW